MPLGLILSLSVTAVTLVISMAFKIAGKLRLTLPLAYFLIAAVSTFFTDWTDKNEQLVLMGLYVLIGLVVLSWIYSIVKKIRNRASGTQYERNLEQFAAFQIQRAREMGIPLTNIRFDEDGYLLHPETGKPILEVVDE